MNVRRLFDRFALVLTAAALCLAMGYLAGCPVPVTAAARTRFTRVGFDALDDATSVSVIHDAESGQCRAFIAQFGSDYKSNYRSVSVSDTWPVACDGMGLSSFRTGGLPSVPASAIR